MSYVVLLQGPKGCGKTKEARDGAHGLVFRAPHHTVLASGLLSELAIAAGGTLFLDEWPEFNRLTLRAMWSTWRMMAPEVRPVVLLGWTPCLERTGFDGPEAHWDRVESLTAGLPPIGRHEVF